MKVPLNMRFKSENIIKCHLEVKVCKLGMYPALYPKVSPFSPSSVLRLSSL